MSGQMVFSGKVQHAMGNGAKHGKHEFCCVGSTVPHAAAAQCLVLATRFSVVAGSGPE